jgi:hypothetical protein
MAGCPYYHFLENCYSPGKDCGHREAFCRGDIISRFGPEILDMLDADVGGSPGQLRQDILEHF